MNILAVSLFTVESLSLGLFPLCHFPSILYSIRFTDETDCTGLYPSNGQVCLPPWANEGKH